MSPRSVPGSRCPLSPGHGESSWAELPAPGTRRAARGGASGGRRDGLRIAPLLVGGGCARLSAPPRAAAAAAMAARGVCPGCGSAALVEDAHYAQQQLVCAACGCVLAEGLLTTTYTEEEHLRGAPGPRPGPPRAPAFGLALSGLCGPWRLRTPRVWAPVPRQGWGCSSRSRSPAGLLRAGSAALPGARPGTRGELLLGY